MKGKTVMKTLRYLLIVLVVALASVSAQAQFASGRSQSSFNQAQLAQYEFQSTSMMASSGSMLPQAAVDGTSTTTDESSGVASGRRRIGGNTSGGSDDRDDPMENPIGDGMWVLLLLAGGYCAYTVYRKRKVVKA